MAPDRRESAEELNQLHEGWLDLARRQADSDDDPMVTVLQRRVPIRPPLRDTPVIIDTDIGGDPDDALALVIAAGYPQLSLVLTSDEQHGQRAMFARQLLDACGRADVPVVTGTALPGPSQFCVADLLAELPPTTAAPDLITAVAAVVEAATDPGLVRWVGLGPLTNLARVAAARPDLLARLRVTQMGGAFEYRDPHRAEHNFRRDLPATRAALAAVERPWLVTSDVTFTEELAIDASSPIYQRLADPDGPPWAKLLRAHLDRWFTAHYRSTMQHDPVALSVALALPFVDVDLDRIALDDRGRMRLDPTGTEAFYSHTVDYPAVRGWLAAQLDPTAGDRQPRPEL